jgi:hypothetical protein
MGHISPHRLCASRSFRTVIEREVVGGRLLVGGSNLDNSSRTIAYFAYGVLKMPSLMLPYCTRNHDCYLFSNVFDQHDIDIESHLDFSPDYDTRYLSRRRRSRIRKERETA